MKCSMYFALVLKNMPDYGSRDEEERVKGGWTGLTDRTDMSGNEESSDKGYFAHDSLEVTAIKRGR